MVKIILVGGTGRSGTSILKETLALHPQAASLPFEYRFIIDPDGIVDFYAGFTAVWSPYIADRRLKRLERFLRTLAREPWYHRLAGRLIQWFDPRGRLLSPRAYHGWELNRHLPRFEHHVDTLMSELIAFSFPACWVGTEGYTFHPRIYHSPPRSREELAPILRKFIHNVIGDLLKETGKAFFVEDNTWNVLLAREILEILPQARIVHIYRDPRDVVASFSRQRWSPRDKVQGALWYRSMMSRWFEIRSSLPPHSLYEVSLERFVREPKEVLQEICLFAEIPFHERMLQIDLSRSHSGRWKREFNPEEKRQVQEILGDLIRALGYPLEEEGP